MRYRKTLTLLVSAGCHLAFWGALEASVFSAPEASVLPGRTRLEMRFMPRPEPQPDVRRPEPAEAAIAPETSPVPPPTEKTSAPSQLPEEGAIWAEPRTVLNPPPRYPRAALLKDIQGRVDLIVTVDPSGRPLTVEVERTSGHTILDQAALDAVRRWVFEPAYDGTRAVASRSRIPVLFKTTRR